MIDLPQEIPPRFVCWLVHVNGSASGTEAQAAFRAVMGYIAEVEAIETAILAGNQADTEAAEEIVQRKLGIAGLLNTTRRNEVKDPYLADKPALRAIFRSKDLEAEEKEFIRQVDYLMREYCYTTAEMPCCAKRIQRMLRRLVMEWGETANRR